MTVSPLPDFDAVSVPSSADNQRRKPQIGLLSSVNLAQKAVPGRKIRCFYWPWNAALQNEPVSQQDALSKANVEVIDMVSYDPALLARSLPKETFAIQFLQIPPAPTGMRRLTAFFGKSRFIEDPVFMIGEVEIREPGVIVLKPVQGNSILVEIDTEVLHKATLRPAIEVQQRNPFPGLV